MEPNFIVIGAPKAATTSICTFLGRHPEVFVSYPKEPFFFCYDDVYAKGWDWYLSLFESANGQKAIGEGSTPYAQVDTFPKTVERIHKHLPHAKLIYSVRHPIERLESHWIEMYSQGLTMQPFLKAVREDIQYIDASSYWKQLSAYRRYFPDERILIIFFEDYRQDPDRVLQQCFEFLEVDSTVRLAGTREPVYASAGKRRDLWLTNILRRSVPGFLELRNRAPKGIRTLAKRWMKAEIEGRPTWDEATRRWAREQLKADSQEFLQYCGRPVDYWTLA